MRILALSDVHYPSTDKEDLASALRQAKADKVVFLGDTVEDRGRAEEFLEVVRSTGCWDYTFLQGDEDEGLLGEKYLEVTAAGKRFIFTHGNQFNIHSDRLTRRIVRALKRIHHSLPVLAYVIRAKLGFRTDSGYLILGHSHALAYFPRLKVGCAGCLTTKQEVYNGRGYIVIDAGQDKTTLSTVSLHGEERTFVL